MASSPSAVVLQAALDGDLHLLCGKHQSIALFSLSFFFFFGGEHLPLIRQGAIVWCTGLQCTIPDVGGNLGWLQLRCSLRGSS